MQAKRSGGLLGSSPPAPPAPGRAATRATAGRARHRLRARSDGVIFANSSLCTYPSGWFENVFASEMTAELFAGDDLRRQLRESGVAAGGHQAIDEQLIGRLHGAAERIAEELGGEGAAHLIFLELEVIEESGDAGDLGLVAENAGIVNRFAVGIFFAPTAGGIVVLQREAKRIDAHVTVGAGGIAFVRFQLFAQGEIAEVLFVCRKFAGVGRRRGNRGSQDAAQYPIAAFDGAGAQGRGSGGEDRAEAEQTAALEAAESATNSTGPVDLTSFFTP